MTDDNHMANEQRLLTIFHPHLMKKLQEAQEANTRLVHYTTADAAMKILKSKDVWLRKTSCMSDYMEVKHGIDCLVNA